MLHQLCGEKTAIFIHICSLPTTIFSEKKRDKKRFSYLIKIHKRNGSLSPEPWEVLNIM